MRLSRTQQTIVALTMLFCAPAMSADLRDVAASRVLETLAVEPATCWNDIVQEAPMILFCGTTETGDMRPLRKTIDDTLLASPGVTKPNGRWLWSGLRDYQGRKYDTDVGPLEVRIYATKHRVVLGYLVPFGAKDVVVVSCDDPSMTAVFEGVRAVDADDAAWEAPVPIQQVPAVYPEPARTLRMIGKVDLKVRLDVEGEVDAACLMGVNRTGFDFEQAAVAAVLSWRFRPARYDGRPVECATTTTVDFKR